MLVFVYGFGGLWVGLGPGSKFSQFCGLGWVKEIGPTDNSATNRYHRGVIDPQRYNGTHRLRDSNDGDYDDDDDNYKCFCEFFVE